MEKKIKGGTVVGLIKEEVEKPKVEKAEKSKAEPKKKKTTK